MLLPDHYSPEKLTELVRELITTAQVKANLQRFRDELARTDAVSLAADALERAIRQREVRRPARSGAAPSRQLETAP